MKYISSFNAVFIGLVFVIVTALIFMLLGIVSGILFVKNNEMHPLLIFVLFVPLSLLIYFPFWSYSLAKWRVWSYKRVDDIHIFNELGAKRGLIYPENSIYRKYDFISISDKLLERKILSKRKTENNIEILLQSIGSKNIVVRSLKSFFSNKPLLIISIKGITFHNRAFYKWNEFSLFELEWDKFGRYPDYSIIFKLKYESKKNILNVNHINISYLKLDYYIKTFKKLSENF